MNRTLVAMLSLSSLAALAQSPLEDIQASHIEANVPAQGSFDVFLKRDLLAYFRGTETTPTTSLEYELLRDAPTQSGVSYPKYYLWVRVRSGSSVLKEGAARVAAIERKRFEVTNFMSRSSIQSSPSEVGAVFPAALVPSVLSRAGVK